MAAGVESHTPQGVIRVGAAIGERGWWRCSARKVKVEHEDRVGDVDQLVTIAIERGKATRLGRSREKPVERARGVRESAVRRGCSLR